MSNTVPNIPYFSKILLETFGSDPREPMTMKNQIDPNFGKWLDLFRSKVNFCSVLVWIDTTISYSALSSGAVVTVLSAGASESYKIRSIRLSSPGTLTGGDRNISIKDSSGTHVYSVIPSTALTASGISAWGSTNVPFPATLSDLITGTVAGENLVVAYSGGTTDYTVGTLTLSIEVEKVL